MKIHLIGIGGAGMSGLALCLRARGDSVSGSDVRRSPALEALERQGIAVSVGHAESFLPPGVELVVRSAAVKEDNPEAAAAARRGVPMIRYAEMVGRLMEQRKSVAVAGCHGKTTTTAMITTILHRAGLDPSYICGGVIRQTKSNAAWGTGEAMVVEACEYDRSFLALHPQVAVLTNIEEDHLDTYRDLGEIVEAFRAFVGKTPAEGKIIGCVDSPPVAALLPEFGGRAEGYALDRDADWSARRIEGRGGTWSFEGMRRGTSIGGFRVGVPGRHNAANALAAIAAADAFRVDPDASRAALAEFRGVARRFERVGEVRGTVVMDDYGHHPTEIRATLRAVRECFPDRKVWCIFQPHQYSRTRLLFRDFARAFGDADTVILPEIYAARDTEEDRRRVSSHDLARAIGENGCPALFLPTFDEIVSFVRPKTDGRSVMITMGAGNIDEVARRIVEGN